MIDHAPVAHLEAAEAVAAHHHGSALSDDVFARSVRKAPVQAVRAATVTRACSSSGPSGKWVAPPRQALLVALVNRTEADGIFRQVWRRRARFAQTCSDLTVPQVVPRVRLGQAAGSAAVQSVVSEE